MFLKPYLYSHSLISISIISHNRIYYYLLKNRANKFNRNLFLQNLISVLILLKHFPILFCVLFLKLYLNFHSCNFNPLIFFFISLFFFIIIILILLNNMLLNLLLLNLLNLLDLLDLLNLLDLLDLLILLLLIKFLLN